MMLALRLARRELRGGASGLRVVLVCLALGVAAIAGVGSLRAAIDAGLADQGRALLGGDLEISGGAQRLPGALRSWLRARGARLSDVVQLRSLLTGPHGERQLIELKAVDPAYPLVGAVDLSPAQPIGQALAGGGIVAERLVAEKLGVAPGATLRLGDATVTLRAILTDAPDEIGGRILLGPQAIIALKTLPATHLVVPGSMVNYALRVVLPKGTDIAATRAALRVAFPDTGWRIRDEQQAAPGVQRFIGRTALFLTLVGLSALLVGGIGVATGVRSWLEGRARSIAILRCLGAPSRLVFSAYLIQALALAAIGVLAGVIAGAALPWAAVAALGSALPVPPRLGLYPEPLALAALYGLLTAVCFALWPLGRAARIPGAALFRDPTLPQRAAGRGRLLAVNAVVGLALAALVIGASSDRRFALWFVLAAGITLAAFRLGAAALAGAAARAPSLPRFWARLGLANLHRPGSPAGLMLVAVGIGLSTLASVALIEANIRHQLLAQLPANAPSFYFIDIQDSQMPDFLRLARAQPGVSDIHHVPNLRARIVSVAGVPAARVPASQDTRWALRGDDGLSFAATPPPGTHLVAGHWWPADYAGPPLVSMDAHIAAGWGVQIGDVIRMNVLGRDIDLRVASLRDVAWRRLSLNFVFVASPGLISGAPHTNVATLRVPP
ncbi:MAG TPA: FtsX-like permease family protein, partial [Acetobacteraceae bacterium]|nr:FtsX-like permease family protein [Acetobacteraceae bacterium]